MRSTVAKAGEAEIGTLIQSDSIDAVAVCVDASKVPSAQVFDEILDSYVDGPTGINNPNVHDRGSVVWIVDEAAVRDASGLRWLDQL